MRAAGILWEFDHDDDLIGELEAMNSPETYGLSGELARAHEKEVTQMKARAKKEPTMKSGAAKTGAMGRKGAKAVVAKTKVTKK